MLFTLYINDIPSDPEVNIGIYADDTAIYTTSWSTQKITTQLNSTLEKILKWCETWRIKINAEKSESVLFRRKRKIARRDQNTKPPEFGNTPIPWKSSARYLGMHLDSKLTFTTHTTQAKNKAYGALAKLTPLINKHVGVKNGLLMYKLLIRPIATYASTIWGGAFDSNIKKLERMQNIALKRITQAPRFTPMSKIREELGLPVVIDYIHQKAENYYASAKNNESQLIRQLGAYEFDPLNKHRKPRDFLHDKRHGTHNPKKPRQQLRN